MEGRLIKMAPIGIDHVSIVNQLAHLFYKAITHQAIIQIQSPVLLNKNYMPEPDISLAKYRSDFYRTRRVKAEDILLIIEVANSSFKYDSEIKLPAYAEFNIPEVWIIDINSQELIRYYQPENGVYNKIETLKNLEKVTLTTLPEITLNLTNLF